MSNLFDRVMKNVRAKLGQSVRNYYDPSQARGADGKWVNAGAQAGFHLDMAEKLKNGNVKRRHVATALAAGIVHAVQTGDTDTANKHIASMEKVVTALRAQIHHAAKGVKDGTSAQVEERKAAYEHYKGLLKDAKAYAAGKTTEAPQVSHFKGLGEAPEPVAATPAAQAAPASATPAPAAAPEPQPAPAAATAPEPEPEPEPTPAAPEKTYTSDPATHAAASAALMQQHTTLTMRGAGIEGQEALSLGMAHHWAGVASSALADGKDGKAAMAQKMLGTHLAAAGPGTTPENAQHVEDLKAVHAALGQHLNIEPPAPQEAPKHPGEAHLTADFSKMTPEQHQQAADELHDLAGQKAAAGDPHSQIYSHLATAHQWLGESKGASHVGVQDASAQAAAHATSQAYDLAQKAGHPELTAAADALEKHVYEHAEGMPSNAPLHTPDAIIPPMDADQHKTVADAFYAAGKMNLGAAHLYVSSGMETQAMGDSPALHLKAAQQALDAQHPSQDYKYSPHGQSAADAINGMKATAAANVTAVQQSGLQHTLGDKMEAGHHSRVADMLTAAAPHMGLTQKDDAAQLAAAHSALAALKSGNLSDGEKGDAMNAAQDAVNDLKMADLGPLLPYHTSAVDALAEIKAQANGGHGDTDASGWDQGDHLNAVKALGKTGAHLSGHNGAVADIAVAHNSLALAKKAMANGNATIAQDHLNDAHTALAGVNPDTLPAWLKTLHAQASSAEAAMQPAPAAQHGSTMTPADHLAAEQLVNGALNGPDAPSGTDKYHDAKYLATAHYHLSKSKDGLSAGDSVIAQNSLDKAKSMLEGLAPLGGKLAPLHQQAKEAVAHLDTALSAPAAAPEPTAAPGAVPSLAAHGMAHASALNGSSLHTLTPQQVKELGHHVQQQSDDLLNAGLSTAEEAITGAHTAGALDKLHHVLKNHEAGATTKAKIGLKSLTDKVKYAADSYAQHPGSYGNAVKSLQATVDHLNTVYGGGKQTPQAWAHGTSSQHADLAAALGKEADPSIHLAAAHGWLTAAQYGTVPHMQDMMKQAHAEISTTLSNPIKPEHLPYAHSAVSAYNALHDKLGMTSGHINPTGDVAAATPALVHASQQPGYVPQGQTAAPAGAPGALGGTAGQSKAWAVAQQGGSPTSADHHEETEEAIWKDANTVSQPGLYGTGPAKDVAYAISNLHATAKHFINGVADPLDLPDAIGNLKGMKGQMTPEMYAKHPELFHLAAQAIQKAHAAQFKPVGALTQGWLDDLESKMGGDKFIPAGTATAAAPATPAAAAPSMGKLGAEVQSKLSPNLPAHNLGGLTGQKALSVKALQHTQQSGLTKMTAEDHDLMEKAMLHDLDEAKIYPANSAPYDLAEAMAMLHGDAHKAKENGGSIHTNTIIPSSTNQVIAHLSKLTPQEAKDHPELLVHAQKLMSDMPMTGMYQQGQDALTALKSGMAPLTAQTTVAVPPGNAAHVPIAGGHLLGPKLTTDSSTVTGKKVPAPSTYFKPDSQPGKTTNKFAKYAKSAGTANGYSSPLYDAHSAMHGAMYAAYHGKDAASAVMPKVAQAKAKLQEHVKLHGTKGPGVADLINGIHHFETKHGIVTPAGGSAGTVGAPATAGTATPAPMAKKASPAPAASAGAFIPGLNHSVQPNGSVVFNLQSGKTAKISMPHGAPTAAQGINPLLNTTGASAVVAPAVQGVGAGAVGATLGGAGSNTAPVAPVAPSTIPPLHHTTPVTAPGTLDTLDHAQVTTGTGQSMGGSNGAMMHTGKDGVKRVVKVYGKNGGSSPNTQAYGEHVVNKIYDALGIPVAKTALASTASGQVAHVSEMIDPASKALGSAPSAADAQEVLKGFAADVLLGNRDAVGLGGDNIKKLPNGTMVRIDNGGSLLHRAMGTLKKPDELTDLGELTTLQTKNPDYAKVFHAAGVDSWKDIPGLPEQIKRISQSLTDANIDKLVAAHPNIPDTDREAIKSALRTRRDKLTALIPQIEQHQAATVGVKQKKYEAEKKAYETTMAQINSGQHPGDTLRQKIETGAKIIQQKAAAGELPHHKEAAEYLKQLGGVTKLEAYGAIRTDSQQNFLDDVDKVIARGGAIPKPTNKTAALAHQYAQTAKYAAITNMSGDKAMNFIEMGKGQTTFHGVSSAGGDNAQHRMQQRAEVEAGGLKIWSPQDGADRSPIYAGFAPAVDHQPPPPYHLTHTDYGGYGSSVAIEMHPHVTTDRAAFTISDSLGMHIKASADGGMDKRAMNHSEAVAAKACAAASNTHLSRFEAIIGGGVTMEDVRAMRAVAQDEASAKVTADKLRAKLDANGYHHIPVYLHIQGGGAAGDTVKYHSGTPM